MTRKVRYEYHFLTFWKLATIDIEFLGQHIFGACELFRWAPIFVFVTPDND